MFSIRPLNIVVMLAKWPPAALLVPGVLFGLCLLFAVTQFATGAGAPVGWLVVGVVGLAIVGKGIALKYAKELAHSKAEQDQLNS